MPQLDADRYEQLTLGATYGRSDGLFYDKTNDLLVGVINDLIVFAIPVGGLSGDVTVSGSGIVAIGANKVLVSMLGANLGKGYIPLDITTAKIIAGNAIGNTSEGLFPDGNTAPSLARVNGATDKQLRLIWASSSSVEVQFAPFAYPPDLDDAADLTVNFLTSMAGATDTPVLTVGYFEGVGDTDAGGDTAALSTSIAKKSVTILAANIGASPKSATICLTPGAHTTDALNIYAAWIEYQRKS